MNHLVNAKSRPFDLDRDGTIQLVRLDCRGEPGKSKGGFPNGCGPWVRIWCSRPGVVSSALLDQDDFSTRYTLTPAADFNDQTDYLVAEEMFTARAGSDAERRDYRLLMGKMPLWACFPMAWHNWVTNEDVLASAVKFILSQIPDAKPAIDAAQEANDATVSKLAWLIVADMAERLKKRPFPARQILPKDTYTSIIAMPVRLAKKLGDHKARWTPAIPEPGYIAPEKSDRVLFVAPDQTSGLDS